MSLVAKASKVMVQPINLVFRFLQGQTRVSIWISHAKNKRIEGITVGFDEFMNLVLKDAEEINIRTNFRLKLGKTLLRGNTILLIQMAEPIHNRPSGSTVADTTKDSKKQPKS